MPVDAGDDAVVVTVSVVKALFIDSRSDLVMIVGLAEGFIVLLVGEVKDRWVVGTIGVNILTE